MNIDTVGAPLTATQMQLLLNGGLEAWHPDTATELPLPVAMTSAAPLPALLREDAYREVTTAGTTTNRPGVLTGVFKFSGADEGKSAGVPVPTSSGTAPVAAPPPTAPAPRTLPLAQVLNVFGWLGKSFNNTGEGYSEYWIRKHSDNWRVATALSQSLKLMADTLPLGLTRTSLEAYSAQLANLEWNGRGSDSYWMSRSKEVVTLLNDVGAQLSTLSAGVSVQDAVHLRRMP